MENKIFYVSQNFTVTIVNDELFLNNRLYTERQQEKNEIYSCTAGKSEDELIDKVYSLFRRQYIKSLEKLLSADNLFVLTGAGSSKDDALFGGKLMPELWRVIEETIEFEKFLSILKIAILCSNRTKKTSTF